MIGLLSVKIALLSTKEGDSFNKILSLEEKMFTEFLQKKWKTQINTSMIEWEKVVSRGSSVQNQEKKINSVEKGQEREVRVDHAMKVLLMLLQLSIKIILFLKDLMIRDLQIEDLEKTTITKVIFWENLSNLLSKFLCILANSRVIFTRGAKMKQKP